MLLLQRDLSDISSFTTGRSNKSDSRKHGDEVNKTWTSLGLNSISKMHGCMQTLKTIQTTS